MMATACRMRFIRSSGYEPPRSFSARTAPMRFPRTRRAFGTACLSRRTIPICEVLMPSFAYLTTKDSTSLASVLDQADASVMNGFEEPLFPFRDEYIRAIWTTRSNLATCLPFLTTSLQQVIAFDAFLLNDQAFLPIPNRERGLVLNQLLHRPVEPRHPDLDECFGQTHR